MEIQKPRADPKFMKRKKFVKSIVRKELAKNQKLDHFLASKKVKGQYIRNITERMLILYPMIEEREEDRRIIDEVKRRMSGNHPIDHSFTWSATPQGHEFWSNLNSEYIEDEYYNGIYKVLL